MSNVISSKLDGHGLVIDWPDGLTSSYDLLWLRDNCTCSQCGNRAQGQKRTSMLEIPENPRIDHHHWSSDGELQVTWKEDGHRSRYSWDWLRAHSYSEQCRKSRSFQPELWDSSLQHALPEFEMRNLEESADAQRNMLDSIVSRGFCLVHGVPTDEEGFQKLLDLVGYVKETNYGRICDLKVTSEGRLLGDTNAPIPLHTDECYRHANPGMLAFHCLSTSEDGGGANLLADGFRMAETLREQHPEDFDLLSRIPLVSRRYHDGEADLISASPVLSVDYYGQLQGIRYNERSAAPLDVPPDLVRPVYRALRKWLELTRDPSYQVRIWMQPGDAVVFDNQRVLHGRDEFNGNRHLLYAQLDLDEPHSRSRVMAAQNEFPHWRTYTHRGT